MHICSIMHISMYVHLKIMSLILYWASLYIHAYVICMAYLQHIFCILFPSFPNKAGMFCLANIVHTQPTHTPSMHSYVIVLTNRVVTYLSTVPAMMPSDHSCELCLTQLTHGHVRIRYHHWSLGS